MGYGENFFCVSQLLICEVQNEPKARAEILQKCHVFWITVMLKQKENEKKKKRKEKLDIIHTTFKASYLYTYQIIYVVPALCSPWSRDFSVLYTHLEVCLLCSTAIFLVIESI